MFSITFPLSPYPLSLFFSFSSSPFLSPLTRSSFVHSKHPYFPELFLTLSLLPPLCFLFKQQGTMKHGSQNLCNETERERETSFFSYSLRWMELILLSLSSCPFFSPSFQLLPFLIPFHLSFHFIVSLHSLSCVPFPSSSIHFPSPPSITQITSSSIQEGRDSWSFSLSVSVIFLPLSFSLSSVSQCNNNHCFWSLLPSLFFHVFIIRNNQVQTSILERRGREGERDFVCNVSREQKRQ